MRAVCDPCSVGPRAGRRPACDACHLAPATHTRLRRRRAARRAVLSMCAPCICVAIRQRMKPAIFVIFDISSKTMRCRCARRRRPPHLLLPSGGPPVSVLCCLATLARRALAAPAGIPDPSKPRDRGMAQWPAGKRPPQPAGHLGSLTAASRARLRWQRGLLGPRGGGSAADAYAGVAHLLLGPNVSPAYPPSLLRPSLC